MKILGEGSNREVIVLASRDEVANMMGFYAAYGMPDDGRGLVTGANINVGDFYK